MQRVIANELRVGNIVAGEVGLPALSPHEITPQDIFDIAEGRAKAYPIGLDGKWLSSLGFFYTEGVFIKDPLRFSSLNGWFHKPDFREIGFELIFQPSDIKYVHQLQNLYFALTGEELKAE